MESQWTNKYAILRDLSVAQGRKVPAQIVGSVEAGQIPPVIRIKEETEEEYFQNFVGDGDLYTKPDLDLIKEMINMVRESDPGDNDETEDLVIISKLSRLSEEFIPTNKEANSDNKEATNKVANEQGDTKPDAAVEVNHVNTKQEVRPQKKRRERNVAIMSLLAQELLSNSETSPKDEEVTTLINQTSEKKPEAAELLKPNDFVVDSNVKESVVKVQWLQKPAEPQPAKAKSINVTPMSTLKKKIPAILNLENKITFKRKSDSSSKSSEGDIVPKQTDNVFVPSTHATEYYKMFIERQQVQEIAQEDIWKRAERLMKEIDSKRREKEKLISDTPESAVGHQPANSEDDNIPGLLNPAVRLPQHRHDLPEECKVCMAVAKYRKTAASP